jgi:acetyl esterase
LGLADPGIQRHLLKAVLSLPKPVLRAASGGRAVYVGGRTLDPRFQFLVHAAKRYAATDRLSEEKARETWAQQLSLCSGRIEPGVQLEDITLQGPHGPIQARVYRSEGQHPDMAVIVYLHASDDPDYPPFDDCDAICSILARCGHAPVLCVARQPTYEHRFQACVDEALFVYRHARDEADRYGAPRGYAAIAGDSIGGAFATIVCQELKRLGEPQPSLQVLLYPWVDLCSDCASMTLYADTTLPASPEAPERFLGPEEDPADPLVSPLKAGDLTGLAAAVVVTAGFDPLVDQGEQYARRLRAARVPLVYRCYDHLVHGFAAFTGVVPAADIACREIAGLVREGLEGRIPASTPKQEA